ncbi:MAG: YeeE/YedE family protein [Sideroxydans sp.]|nr:YeeE/YedE family protein [Sideroxydans sp.]
MNAQFLAALAGGILIGSAAVLLLWLNGRIAGVSSMVSNVLFSAERMRPALFLMGIVDGAALYYLLGGSVPVARDGFPVWLLVVAGVLVGIGTGLARGCTSGHGVCGLGRFSLRSLLATLIFLSVAILTTYLVRHVFGVQS